jgi:hypothetical protein
MTNTTRNPAIAIGTVSSSTICRTASLVIHVVLHAAKLQRCGARATRGRDGLLIAHAAGGRRVGLGMVVMTWTARCCAECSGEYSSGDKQPSPQPSHRSSL